jgi:hypothetical protein
VTDKRRRGDTAKETAAEVSAGLRIVRGTPDDEEIAALIASMVAVVAAHRDAEDAASPTSAWMDRSHSMRGRPVGVFAHGDAAWRHSLR